MARACAARLRTIDSSAICLACGLRSVMVASGSVANDGPRALITPIFAEQRSADGTQGAMTSARPPSGGCAGGMPGDARGHRIAPGLYSRRLRAEGRALTARTIVTD